MVKRLLSRGRVAIKRRKKINYRKEKLLLIREQTILAKERTVLSFIRTGLASIGAGIVITLPCRSPVTTGSSSVVQSARMSAIILVFLSFAGVFSSRAYAEAILE